MNDWIDKMFGVCLFFTAIAILLICVELAQTVFR
jgi:hypothetical protein